MVLRRFLLERRGLFLLGVSSLFFTLGNGVVWFVLPLVAEGLIKNLVIVGFLIPMPNMISLLLDVPVGGLSDHIGRKKMLICGLVIMGLLGLLLPSLTSIPRFIVFMLFFGIANMLIFVSSRAYMLDISPEGKTSEYFGIFTTFVQIGFTLAPVLGGYLIGETLTTSGIYDVGYFYLIICILAALIILLLKDIVGERKSIQSAFKELLRQDKIFIRQLSDFKKLKSAGLLVLLLTFALISIDGLVWTIEPLYYNLKLNSIVLPIVSYEIPPAVVVGLILSMFVIPFILFEIPAGIIADRVGKSKMLIVGLLLAGIFMINFGLNESSEILLVSAFIATTGLAIARPSLDGLMADLSMNQKRGGIAGVWTVSEDVGYIIGSFGGGIIAEYYQNIGMAFTVGGVLLLVLSPLVLITLHKKV